MRAFLKTFGGFLAIQLAIALAVLWSYRRQYPSSENFLAASMDKQRLLGTQAPPRLVFVGGSSMAFGVHSAQVAESLGRKPVNMGLHAALGLSFMLEEASRGIRSNDWVVVAPEYQQFVRTSGTSEMLVNMLEIDPRNARLLTRQQWAEAMDLGGLQRIGKITRAVLGHPGRFFRSNSMKRTKPFYRRIGFNQDGDMTAHLGVPSPKMTERQFQFRYREDPVNQTIGRLNEFAALAKSRGASVFFSHPPLPEDIYQQNRTEVERLDAALRERLKFPVLENSADVVFPINHFFDTWYHLAAPGVERRSQLISQNLRRAAARN